MLVVAVCIPKKPLPAMLDMYREKTRTAYDYVLNKDLIK